mmetsp:Transcript_19096/g.29025  ORF Transcript_19096/g.29025 Transcript_19096/m.29025 type:complete len:90 (+) Transcript_19096:658-927(+)
MNHSLAYSRFSTKPMLVCQDISLSFYLEREFSYAKFGVSQFTPLHIQSTLPTKPPLNKATTTIDYRNHAKIVVTVRRQMSKKKSLRTSF